MTDYITRHGDILTIVTVIDDPVYLDEPYVQSTTYTADLTGSTALENCNGSAFAENGGSDRHWVPHFLPGQNTALTEWLKDGTLDPGNRDSRRVGRRLSRIPRYAERLEKGQ